MATSKKRGFTVLALSIRPKHIFVTFFSRIIDDSNLIYFLNIISQYRKCMLKILGKRWYISVTIAHSYFGFFFKFTLIYFIVGIMASYVSMKSNRIQDVRRLYCSMCYTCMCIVPLSDNVLKRILQLRTGLKISVRLIPHI